MNWQGLYDFAGLEIGELVALINKQKFNFFIRIATVHSLSPERRRLENFEIKKSKLL